MRASVWSLNHNLSAVSLSVREFHVRMTRRRGQKGNRRGVMMTCVIRIWQDSSQEDDESDAVPHRYELYGAAQQTRRGLWLAPNTGRACAIHSLDPRHSLNRSGRGVRVSARLILGRAAADQSWPNPVISHQSFKEQT